LNKSIHIVSNQGNKCLAKVGNLIWASTYIREELMQNSVGIVAEKPEALHTSLRVFASQLTGTLWHPTGTKQNVFSTSVKHRTKMPLNLFAAQ